ncbi:MAG TPA: 16S rRNA (guanine(527)-N(7))-methyltransferase RsmG [Burkholderiales bacterium]|nr:16S rRNA (guanine(527)-N(7))-methyltransferase RsmG [Burkholderiales bacterium]
MSLRAALADGLETLRLSVPDAAQTKLLAYIALIEKWNRVYNLTAIREPEKMLSHHVLDSLAVAPHLAGGTVLDVGSGAGLPGIPLAIARPELAVTLLEANHKKAAFMKQALIELGLSEVEIAAERVEAWSASRQFDVVISRAFSDLAEFVTLAARHCSDNGTLAAMKGVYPYEELAQLPAPYEMTAVIPLTVPGLAAERHLVLMRRK